MATFSEPRELLSCPMLLKGSKPVFRWLLDREQLIDRAIIGGLWEPHSTWAIERLVKPGAVCFDVGANIGYYGVLMAHLAGPSGRVLGFEPMPDAQTLAHVHLGLNGLSGEVLRLVLTHPAGESGGLLSDVFFNFSWPPTRCVQPRTWCPVTTLDTVMLRYGFDRLDVVKIDVDGYELRILEGATATLQRYHPDLLLEVCDYTLRGTDYANAADYQYGTGVRTMLALLDGFGYHYYFEETLERVKNIDQVCARADLSKQSINLICTVRDSLA